MKVTCAIFWFRNNLRVHDNPSLLRAIECCESLVCVYCHEPNETLELWDFQRVGPHRQAFLRQALDALDTELTARGQVLIECSGAPEIVLCRLAKIAETTHIFTEDIQAPYETDSLKKLRECGLQVMAIWQSSLIDPVSLPFSVNQLPDVFTDFRHQIEISDVKPEPPLPIPEKLPGLLREFDSVRLETETVYPDRNSSFPYQNPSFSGGEFAALSHLAGYLERRLPDRYKQTRNELSGIHHSSKFSPWLSQGALSVRKVFEALQSYESRFGRNEGTYWLWYELLWRDYFRFLHMKYGQRLYLATGLRSQKSVQIQHNEPAFKRWCHGKTGQSLIDAGMRELILTGYISNRMRQIVASFLVYDLGCDWRAGAAWFESQLIDYDVYSNQGNWLYISGNGTDPRGGRHFNAEKQAKTYDPSGKYQSYWLEARANSKESPALS